VQVLKPAGLATAIAIGVAALSLFIVGVAAANGTGTISGIVTASSAPNQPLQGVCVDATPTAGGGSPGGGQTDSTGSYSIQGLTPGTYTLEFTACSAGNYAPDTITGVQVTAGQTTQNENASLGPGATISGTITDSSTNQPLNGACVQASPSGGGQGATAHTDGTGAYSIQALAPGTYTLLIWGCNAGDYQATTVTGVQASAGQITTENAALTPGGNDLRHRHRQQHELAAPGRVRGCFSRRHQRWDPGRRCRLVFLPGARSGRLHARVPGLQRRQLHPQHDHRRPDHRRATTTENTALTPGATTTGTVTDSSTNQALSGACVDASPSGGGPGGSARTDRTGSYSIQGLPAGAYALTFSGCTAGNYVSQTIPAVQVSAGQTTTENASLAPAGTISGKVTDSSGKALANICVAATGSGPNGQSQGANTDSNGLYTIPGVPPGSYSSGKALAEPAWGRFCRARTRGRARLPARVASTITGLPPGTYSVQFDGCSAGNYVEKTINGVQVTVGQTPTENVSLATGGTISGKVTDSSGKPVAGVCVSAFITGSQAGAGANTDATGTYSFSGQAAGTYTLTFDGCSAGNYAEKTITGVSVTAGQTTTENVSLAPGGTSPGRSPTAPATRSQASAYRRSTRAPTRDPAQAPTPAALTRSRASRQAPTRSSPATARTASTRSRRLPPLTGKVTNTPSQSLVGACVTIGPLPGGRTGTPRTNSSGAYTLTQVPPAATRSRSRAARPATT
jgi:hypothetical protein